MPKKESAKAMPKKESAKAMPKKELAKAMPKKELAKAMPKKVPGTTMLKKESTKTSSKNSEVKISQLGKQFMLLLEELEGINKKHSAKVCDDTLSYDPNYIPVKKAGDRLLMALKNGSIFFFNKPTYDTLHHFKRVCKREIAIAEHEYKKHRGVWRQIKPIAEGVHNILCGLSVVPSLIDAATSKLGRMKPSFRGHKSARQ